MCATPATASATPFGSPDTYTPKHLAESVLTSKAAKFVQPAAQATCADVGRAWYGTRSSSRRQPGAQFRASTIGYLIEDQKGDLHVSLSLTEDIKSVSEFKKRIREVFSQVHRTGRPVVITVNGRPDVVVLDAAVFERKLSALNLRALLAAGESDIATGHTRSARAAVRALRRAKKISR